ncbi:hypothetical protein [Modestobacter sp. DSM 44400]|uniref:hypothetical protein n=1 Tax=Modestobacter sp. DSM 44400 TaxID=1550230 RepID=UPI000B81DC9F|nr:hypothetical protein [Modestobacter sp. DSM 44400]
MHRPEQGAEGEDGGAGELRNAAPKLLRYRLFHLPARLTRGQRKRWLHLRADWPGTDDLIDTWRAVKALPARC